MFDHTISQQIRERIRAARHAAGLSQAQLAELYGCTQSTISGIERGRVQINAQGLARMAEILGQPISFFYPDADIADLTELEQALVREFRQMPHEWQGLVVDYVGAQVRLYRVTEARYRREASPSPLSTTAMSGEGAVRLETPRLDAAISAVERDLARDEVSEAAAPSADALQWPALASASAPGGADEPGPPAFADAAHEPEQRPAPPRAAPPFRVVDEETVLYEDREALARAAAPAVDEWAALPRTEQAAVPELHPARTPEEPRLRAWRPAPLPDADEQDDSAILGTPHGFTPFAAGGSGFPKASADDVIGDHSPDEQARLRLLELIREKAPLMSRRRPRRK